VAVDTWTEASEGETTVRTDPDLQRALYNDLTLSTVAARLSISTELVLALGESGELEITDYRLPGAKRGVYRVSAESVEAFRGRRRIVGQKAAQPA